MCGHPFCWSLHADEVEDSYNESRHVDDRVDADPTGLFADGSFGDQSRQRGYGFPADWRGGPGVVWVHDVTGRTSPDVAEWPLAVADGGIGAGSGLPGGDDVPAREDQHLGAGVVGFAGVSGGGLPGVDGISAGHRQSLETIDGVTDSAGLPVAGGGGFHVCGDIDLDTASHGVDGRLRCAVVVVDGGGVASDGIGAVGQ